MEFGRRSPCPCTGLLSPTHTSPPTHTAFRLFFSSPFAAISRTASDRYNVPPGGFGHSPSEDDSRGGTGAGVLGSRSRRASVVSASEPNASSRVGRMSNCLNGDSPHVAYPLSLFTSTTHRLRSPDSQFRGWARRGSLPRGAHSDALSSRAGAVRGFRPEPSGRSGGRRWGAWRGGWWALDHLGGRSGTVSGRSGWWRPGLLSLAQGARPRRTLCA